MKVQMNAGQTHGLEAPATDTKLKKAAQGIEASFIKTLLEQMQKGSSMFGKGAGAGVYQDFFNQAIAENMASRSEFGIADMIERQMAPRFTETNNPENKTNENK
jgi:Rod binding domain-containing protein